MWTPKSSHIDRQTPQNQISGLWQCAVSYMNKRLQSSFMCLERSSVYVAVKPEPKALSQIRVQTEEDCDHGPVCNAWHCFVLHSLSLSSECEGSWGSATRHPCAFVIREIVDSHISPFASMPRGCRILKFLFTNSNEYV